MPNPARKTYTFVNGQTVDNAVATFPANKDFRDAWQLEGDVITVDWAKARANFRKTASLSKIDFCLALVTLGVLTEEEAIDAAKGNWPTAFEAAFAGVPADVALRAKIEWAAATSVVRRHNMFDLLLPQADITPEQLDTVFGYEGQ